MTHNIVAQFSCSLDEHGNFKEYRVVAGSVFNEEYNETLDSATIVLSQIFKEDRLSNIKPYDFVRVFDKASKYNVETDTYAFDKIYLVDNFDEKENNIKEHIFGYTINLMSETKLLEKIQCPNLTATHDVVNGFIRKKTIFEYIKRYMELYVPKMKFSNDGETWSYEPVVKLPIDVEYHEATLVINYSDGNFEYFSGHGTTYYQFSCESTQLPNTVDYNSVELIQITPNDDDVDWISELIGDFIVGDGVFRINAYSSNSYYGSLTVTYRYKNTIETNPFYEKFNVPCADLAFTAPTLRQLLTILMQQVGCIPVVKNRTLGFLDFQLEAKDFKEGYDDYSINNTVNYIRRSLSSDSFVNALVNMSEQVLDSGNEVICETLGFRDRNNLLLKQTENLKLETSLPIFKVNKCVLRAPGRYTGYLSSSYGCFWGYAGWQGAITGFGGYNWPVIYYFETPIESNTATIKFRFLNSNNTNPNFTVRVDKIYFWSRDSKGYHIVEERDFGNFVLNNSTMVNDVLTYHDIANAVDRTITTKSATKTFNNLGNEVVGYIFSGYFVNETTDESKPFTFIRFDRSDYNVSGHDIYMTDYRSLLGQEYDIRHPWSESFNMSFVARYKLNNLVGFQSWDISKLIVENSVRQLLERDFLTMKQEISSASSATIDTISKYVYGTVGYSIGSKEISGFSDIFNVGTAGISWIIQNTTYIENIVNVLEKNTTISPLSRVVYTFFEGLGYESIQKSNGFNVYFTEMDSPRPTTEQSSNGARESSLYNVINSDFEFYNAGTGEFGDNEMKFFTSLLFDVYYQPLNSFNLAYVKSQEELDFPLEQYDSNASGLTDFDRLSIHEQEQVDRIGNETLTISQRTTNFSELRDFSAGPLAFKDDTNRSDEIDEEDNGIDYIIFKRSFSIGNNCYNASYTGSKDAILKNYFTSIRTKYRAYQYVDYTQSVLRKERDTLFVRIATNYFDGDDKIKIDYSKLPNFIYDINNDTEGLDYNRNISYEVETNNAKVSNGINGYEIIENQTVKNSVSLVSTQNMFAIIYEYADNVGAGTYIKDLTVKNYEGAELGGIPQYWQIWDEDYNISHQVAFTNYIDFYSKFSSANTAQTQLKKIEQSPIVDEEFSYDIIFSVVDDKKTNIDRKTFYKDYAERINHTVEFIYYAPNKDVLVSEDFISGIPLLNRYEKSFNFVYVGTEFYLDTFPHEPHEGDNELASSENGPNFYENYFRIIENEDGAPYLRINFARWPVIKMAHYDAATNLVSDIAAFKSPNPGSGGYVEYFFTINDTKTDYVLSEKNGILYRRYKVRTYTEEQSGNDGPYPRFVDNIYNEED